MLRVKRFKRRDKCSGNVLDVKRQLAENLQSQAQEMKLQASLQEMKVADYVPQNSQGSRSNISAKELDSLESVSIFYLLCFIFLFLSTILLTLL